VLRIHKREDGKFIKSPTYSPADLRRETSGASSVAT
jgi:hypothetical protein